MVARLSGDEFLISMLSTSNKNEIIKIANNIIKDFSEVKVLVNSETNQTLQKTVCIGIDLYNLSSNDANIDKTIKNSDIALYEAKNKGRSQMFFYDELQPEDTIHLF
jgi:diguanylate cyclase (GGDEF)-like protein